MTPADHPGAVADAQARPPGRVSGVAVRVLAYLHRLAEAGWATTAVGAWALLQASLVPGPVDGVLVPLGLADPKRAFRFAWSAVIGSVAGALVAYTLGTLAFESVGRAVLGWLGVTERDVEQSRALFQQRGLWLVLLSTVTPVSTKLVSIAAGAFGVPAVPFLLTILLGRGVRFGVVAAVVRHFGDRAERYIERRYGKTLDELAAERTGWSRRSEFKVGSS
jgi:membrane protein YqaA with SNARE-associated domain